MKSFNLTLAAGSPGVGKTTWISQFFKDASCSFLPGQRIAIVLPGLESSEQSEEEMVAAKNEQKEVA